MKKLENLDTKGDTNDMDETFNETDRQSDSKFIEEDGIAKVRENLKWQVSLNFQVAFNSKYVIYELLESTKHFDLYRAFCKSNREKVVVKIIDKQSIKQSLSSNLVQNKAMIQNQEFLKKLKIQTAVQNKLYNKSSRIFLTQPIQVFENDSCFMKITQNYYDESLQSMIKNRQSFPVQQAIAVLKQIMFTLFQLHKEGIILTQLNPKSIIYRNGVFKVNDFSSMRKVAQSFKSTFNFYHSYSYENVLAPQIAVCPQIVDIKTEIWALGVLFYQMIEHDVPYEYRGISIVKQARSHCIKLNLREKYFCSETTDLLKKMMEINPYERISWKNLVNSGLLTEKEFFFTPKMIPLIDLRIFSLKNKQSSTIPEQVITNGFDKFPINKQNQQEQKKESQLNIKEAFSKVDEKQKINIDQYLDLEEDTFKQVKEINLMVMKAKWILQEILMKLQEEKMVNMKKRSHLEMMCLLADRCQYYMRRAKLLHPLAQDPRPDNYLEQLKKLQNEIQELQINYKQHYKNLKSSPFYVLSSIVKTKHKHKDYFLTKEEGLYFSLQQQVDHTQQFFLNKFISETSPKNYQQSILLQKLKYYSKINRITQKNLQGYLNFAQLANDVLNIKNH